MAATLKPRDPTQETETELPAAEYPGEEIIDTVEPREVATPGFGLAEFGPPARPDRSGPTAIGRFLADEGIGRMERLIRPPVPPQPQATTESAGEKSSNGEKTPSVVAEVGSVCSPDAGRIARDFGGR